MFKKIIYLGVVLTMCLSFAFGCRDELQGTFYSLQGAYEQGLLTQEDLRSISYYYSEHFAKNDHSHTPDCEYFGSAKYEEDDYVPISKNPEALSAKTEKQIKQDLVAAYRAQGDKAKVSKIWITHYFGTYNGCIAIMMDDAYSNRPDDSHGCVDICGVMFHSYYYLSIWKENKNF